MNAGYVEFIEVHFNRIKKIAFDTVQSRTPCADSDILRDISTTY